MVESHNERIPTRQSLLERLRQWDNHAGWQEFFDTYWKLIYRTALQAGLREVEAEEVVQETIIDVARHMPGFKYRNGAKGGSFKQWLLNLTSWRIKDQFRKRKTEHLHHPLFPEEGSEDADIGPCIDPESAAMEARWEAEWEENLGEAAMQRVKNRVNPKHYQVFFLFAVKGWPARRVAANLNVSLTEVYTIKHRVSNQIKATLSKLREHPLD